MLETHCGSLSSLLSVPERTNPKKAPPKKSCGRVLTSLENIRTIEEKERSKKEKARLKEERKCEMERKREEKAKLAAEKKQKIEARKAERAKMQELRKQKNATKMKRKLMHNRGEQCLPLSEKEIELFQKRFENGYDITTDQWYNAWLKAKDSADVCQLSGDASLDRSELDCSYTLDDTVFNLSLSDLPGSNCTGEKVLQYYFYHVREREQKKIRNTFGFILCTLHVCKKCAGVPTEAAVPETGGKSSKKKGLFCCDVCIYKREEGGVRGHFDVGVEREGGERNYVVCTLLCIQIPL